MFDGPHPGGGSGGDEPDFFYIAKVLKSDVARGETIRTTFNGRQVAYTAHELMLAGTVVNFVFTNGIVGVHYELEPGERRSMMGRFE